MKTEEELKLSFSIEVEDFIIRLTYKEAFSGDEDVQQAHLIYVGLSSIFESEPKKMYSMFVDLSGVSSWRYVAEESRALYAKISGHERMQRVAVYGSSVLLGVATSLVARASGKKDSLVFFADRDKALAWLREAK